MKGAIEAMNVGISDMLGRPVIHLHARIGRADPDESTPATLFPDRHLFFSLQEYLAATRHLYTEDERQVGAFPELLVGREVEFEPRLPGEFSRAFALESVRVRPPLSVPSGDARVTP